MYFVYKNNLQMYLTKDAIVMKTWKRFFTIPGGVELFELLKQLVAFLKKPAAYEEILETIAKDKNSIDRALAILIKTNVVMCSQSLSDFENFELLRFENTAEIKNRLELKTIHMVDVPNDIAEELNRRGMKTSEYQGDFELVWCDSIADTNISCSGKVILIGMEQGTYYIVMCDDRTNDIRKAKYEILSKSKKESCNANQRVIFREMVVNRCLSYFFGNGVESNLVIISNDLSVDNKNVELSMKAKTNYKSVISKKDLVDDNTEVIYPDFDEYVNSLANVGYFGSMNCNQFPIPEQEIWLIDNQGQVEQKIKGRGDKCETAMLQSFMNAVNSKESDVNNSYYIADDKQEYYFNLLADGIFRVAEDSMEYTNVQFGDVEIAIAKYADGNVYSVTFRRGEKSRTIYLCQPIDYRKRMIYALIEMGLGVEEAIDTLKQLEKRIAVSNVEKSIARVNEQLLTIISDKGYQAYEEYHACSEELRQKGIYLGRIILDEVKENV